jgi:hypothetical protein
LVIQLICFPADDIPPISRCLVTHAHHLKEMESPVSLISCTLTNDSHQYYCVGTAFVHPEEAEPKSGRLILFHLDDGETDFRYYYILVLVEL